MCSEGSGSHTVRDLKYTIENPRHFVDSMHQKPVNGEWPALAGGGVDGLAGCLSGQGSAEGLLGLGLASPWAWAWWWRKARPERGAEHLCSVLQLSLNTSGTAALSEPCSSQTTTWSQ